jgi:hypothetical protein
MTWDRLGECRRLHHPRGRGADDRAALDPPPITTAITIDGTTRPGPGANTRHDPEQRLFEPLMEVAGGVLTAERAPTGLAAHRFNDVLLLGLMTRRGLGALQQDVIGVHRFQGAGPRQIADLLQLPEDPVARRIAEARPLFRAIAKDASSWIADPPTTMGPRTAVRSRRTIRRSMHTGRTCNGGRSWTRAAG